MLGTERERVLKFYFSRLQRNSRVNSIFSGLFLKRSLHVLWIVYTVSGFIRQRLKNKNVMVQRLKNQQRYFVHYIERNQLYDAITIANPLG
jgi:hypothetical protein